RAGRIRRKVEPVDAGAEKTGSEKAGSMQAEARSAIFPAAQDTLRDVQSPASRSSTCGVASGGLRDGLSDDVTSVDRGGVSHRGAHGRLRSSGLAAIIRKPSSAANKAAAPVCRQMARSISIAGHAVCALRGV